MNGVRWVWVSYGMAGCCFTVVDGMAGCCFTDVVLYSSENHHQEHATEPRRLPKDVVAAWGAVILRYTVTCHCSERGRALKCSAEDNIHM
jgi:hypothetical protein